MIEQEFWVDITEPGPPGPEGAEGAKGPPGERGAEGPVGPKGDTGARGDTGDVGERGPKGDVGAQGPKGDTGDVGERGPKGDVGERGPKGDEGKRGDGPLLLGRYDTVAKLQEAHPVGNRGDAWAVGSEQQNTVYIWSTQENAWQNIGAWVGPKGDTGERGEAGVTPQLIAGSNIEIDSNNPAKPIISAKENPVLGHIQLSTDDTAVGVDAQTNIDGYSQTSIGYSSGMGASGWESTYVGAYSGNNMQGEYNTALGSTAGMNVAGGSNTMIGSSAGFGFEGSSNTVLGTHTGMNRNGSGNILVGARAASKVYSGDDSTFIGTDAGIDMYWAEGCTYVGAQTSGVEDNVNQTAIGHQARSSASNQVVLGNDKITSLVCQVSSINSLSDKRTKEYYHPADLKLCLDTVQALPTYRYKYHDFTGTHLDSEVTGFIADDVERVFPKTVHISDKEFARLDEQGKQRMRTEVDPDTGEEIEVPDTFLMEDVKEIAATDQLIATLWGAVQQLAAEVEILKAGEEVTALQTAAVIDQQCTDARQAVGTVLRQK